MTNAIQPAQNFQERISDKIKDLIGDMMTSDDLKPYIERSISEVFFHRPIISGRGSYNEKYGDPIIHTLIKDAIGAKMEETVKGLVDDWFSENLEFVTSTVKDVVQHGVGNAVLASISTRFQTDLAMFESNVMNRMHELHTTR